MGRWWWEVNNEMRKSSWEGGGFSLEMDPGLEGAGSTLREIRGMKG